MRTNSLFAAVLVFSSACAGLSSSLHAEDSGSTLFDNTEAALVATNVTYPGSAEVGGAEQPGTKISFWCKNNEPAGIVEYKGYPVFTCNGRRITVLSGVSTLKILGTGDKAELLTTRGTAFALDCSVGFSACNTLLEP